MYFAFSGKKKPKNNFVQIKKSSIFAILKTEDVAQLVRASDCGSEGRGFEPPLPPKKKDT